MMIRVGVCALSIVVGITLALLAPSLFSMNGGGAAAHMTVEAVTDKNVQGIVYDQAANPIPGANVTVEIWGGDWPDQAFFRTSKSTVTDTLGFYEVTFSSNYWSPHNTIRIIVTYGSYQKAFEVEANEDESQTVNMFMNLTISEFSGPSGLLAIVAGCMIPTAFLLARRRR